MVADGANPDPVMVILLPAAAVVDDGVIDGRFRVTEPVPTLLLLSFSDKVAASVYAVSEATFGMVNVA